MTSVEALGGGEAGEEKSADELHGKRSVRG